MLGRAGLTSRWPTLGLRRPAKRRATSIGRHAALLVLVLPRAATAQRLVDLPRAARAPSTIERSAAAHAAPLTLAEVDNARGMRIRRGALWGLAIYGVAAAAYVIHESATCRGPDCFGEGQAWLGLAAGVPVALGIGAAVGAVWPGGS